MSLKGSYQCGGSFGDEWRLADSSERLKNDSDERHHHWLSISLSNGLLTDFAFSPLFMRGFVVRFLRSTWQIPTYAPLWVQRAYWAYRPDPDRWSEVLQRLGLFNFNDTWLPEENTDSIKRLDRRLEASSSLGNLERVRERSLKNLAKRRNPWATRWAKIIIRNALTLTLIGNTRVSDENIMALTAGACKTLWLWC